MLIRPYRHVLALPGVSRLLLVTLAARVPASAVTVVFTLHVVRDLHRGYGAAGAVTAAYTLGNALGAPLLGRMIDRGGLRPVLLLATCGQAVFWPVSPALDYLPLVVLATAAGVVTLPVYPVARQAIAVLVVPADQRRTAYALDSLSIELSYMIGPATAVLLVTRYSARVAMIAVGATVVLSGIALIVQDPPVRARSGTRHASRPARRDWMGPAVLAQFAAAAATAMVLAGTDVALVAALRSTGQVGWTGTVVAVWSAASLTGGLVFGLSSRTVPPALLAGLLGVATIPVGLAGGWPWICLGIVPAGALCAPAITASTFAVSWLTPPTARGESLGWHSSALTLGLALGAPVTGAVIDAWSPAGGFAIIGAIGAAAAFAMLPLSPDAPGGQRSRRGRATDRDGGAAQPDATAQPGGAGLPEALPT